MENAILELKLLQEKAVELMKTVEPKMRTDEQFTSGEIGEALLIVSTLSEM